MTQPTRSEWPWNFRVPHLRTCGSASWKNASPRYQSWSQATGCLWKGSFCWVKIKSDSLSSVAHSPKEPAMSVRSKMASMTSQFSRLNPMNRLKVTAQKSAPPDPTPEDEGGEAIKANPEPLPPSPSLSPNLSGQRFQSKSSEDLPSEVVVSSEEAPAAKDQFLSPFAKITSGFKIMTTAGGQGQEAPEQDPFYQKVIHSKSKTKVLLL